MKAAIHHSTKEKACIPVAAGTHALKYVRA